MQVYQTRGYDQPVCFDHVMRVAVADVCIDGSDLSARDGDVSFGVQTLAGVYHRTVFDDQVPSHFSPHLGLTVQLNIYASKSRMTLPGVAPVTSPSAIAGMPLTIT